jgi:hypothetical protein
MCVCSVDVELRKGVALAIRTSSSLEIIGCQCYKLSGGGRGMNNNGHMHNGWHELARSLTWMGGIHGHY